VTDHKKRTTAATKTETKTNRRNHDFCGCIAPKLKKAKGAPSSWQIMCWQLQI